MTPRDTLPFLRGELKLGMEVLSLLSNEPLGKAEKGDALTRGIMSPSYEASELGNEVPNHLAK